VNAVRNDPHLRRHGWIDRGSTPCRDLAEPVQSNPMTDAVVDEIDGRMIASATVAGGLRLLQLPRLRPRREIIDVVPEYLERWGTHPSWSRLLGSPVLYEEIEERLTELIGAEDILVLPTITLIHMSVIPVLAGGGRSSWKTAHTRRSTTAASSPRCEGRRSSGSRSRMSRI
jgi:8-amino-7-oxononanoate synthase